MAATGDNDPLHLLRTAITTGSVPTLHPAGFSQARATHLRFDRGDLQTFVPLNAPTRMHTLRPPFQALDLQSAFLCYQWRDEEWHDYKRAARILNDDLNAAGKNEAVYSLAWGEWYDLNKWLIGGLPTGHDLKEAEQTETANIPKWTSLRTSQVNGPGVEAVLELLQKHFSGVDQLWHKMAEYNAGISGSAALELFRPNSSDAESDIDFYVTPNIHCVVGIIKALEHAGVVFEGPFDRIRSLLIDSGEYHCTIAQAKMLIISFDTFWKHKLLSPLLRLFVEALRQPVNAAEESRRTFEIEGRLTLVIKDSHRQEYHHLPEMSVIRGQSIKSKKSVQLIFAPGKSLLEQICHFHSSITQALLTPSGAIHMYGNMAVRGEAFSWRGNTTSSTGLIDPRLTRYHIVREKWTRRGVTFQERPDGPSTSRRICDEGSYLRIYPNVAVDPSLADMRAESFQAFIWYEDNERTTAVPPLGSLVRQPFAPYLEHNEHFPDAEELCMRFAIHVQSLRTIDPVKEIFI